MSEIIILMQSQKTRVKRYVPASCEIGNVPKTPSLQGEWGVLQRIFAVSGSGSGRGIEKAVSEEMKEQDRGKSSRHCTC
jgi:hypothetical protein